MAPARPHLARAGVLPTSVPPQLAPADLAAAFTKGGWPEGGSGWSPQRGPQDGPLWRIQPASQPAALLQPPPGTGVTRPPRLSLAGAVQLLQLLLCLLLLACSSVSYRAVGGYTGLLSLGSPYYYQYGGAYSGLSGADGARAQQLDAHFHQLKQPPARAAMAVGGALVAAACLLLLAGLVELPLRCPAWLLAEGVLQAAVAAGLAPGLYFYLRSLQETYGTALCRERESLYRSKGYQGFGCSLHAAEIGVGLVAGAAVVAFLAGAGLAVRDFRGAQQPPAKPAETRRV